MMRGTMRGKIIFNSVLILFILMFVTLYTGLATFDLTDSVGVLFNNNLLLKSIRETIGTTEASLTLYLTSKSSDALKDYIRNSTQLSETSRKLNTEIRNDSSLLLQRDLARSIEEYIAEADACVAAKRGRDVQGYTASYYESERTAEIIRYLIDENERVFISDSLAAFSNFRQKIPNTIVTNVVIVIAATLLGLMLLIYYSYKLTEPITMLAAAARAVGRGDYDAELPPIAGNDEIGIMAKAFSTMRDNVRKAFEELKSKADLEKKFMEERMIVLDMEHKLKNAELLALQSQINPHFLYNTLSAGMGIAWSEKANRTSKFLEDLATFIRYALKPASRMVRVEDEIECAQRYINLLHARFGARYRFDIEVDPGALDVETPALLLQPLIENAVTHGLGSREQGGFIKVLVRSNENDVTLSVRDDGEGMSSRDIAAVLDDPIEEETETGHGIGLKNVRRRILLSTNGRGWLDIERNRSEGTEVSIHLPRRG